MSKKEPSISADVDTYFPKKYRYILILIFPILLVLICFVTLLVYTEWTSLDISRDISSQTSNSQQFTHPDLPGFSFDIPEGWNIEITKLFDVVDLEQYSDPVNLCYESCMIIKLSKEDMSFNMNFTRQLSSSVYYEVFGCSNSVGYESLENGWYKINGNDGYLYTRTVRFDVRVDDRYIPDTELEKDGFFEELVNGNTYQLCRYSRFDKSNRLKEKSPAVNIAGDYRWVTMNDIVIDQDLDSPLIAEINQIISSIQGLENLSIEPDMSDWKEYRNTKYGFTLKYPDDNLTAEEYPIFPEKRKNIMCPDLFSDACPNFGNNEYEIRFNNKKNEPILKVLIFWDEDGSRARFHISRVSDGFVYMIDYDGDALVEQKILESMRFIEKDKPKSCLWIGDYNGYTKSEVSDTEESNRSELLNWGSTLTEAEAQLKQIRDSLIRHDGWKYDWEVGCMEVEYYTYGESKRNLLFKNQQECLQVCENLGR